MMPLVLLAVLAVLVLSALPRSGLSVSFLDVGQGDAIFIESPTGVQMLIDGGSGPAVLRELGRRMPLFDRTLDVVVATHPDRDHIGGLSDVFKRYMVGAYLESGVHNDTSSAEALARAVAEEQLEPVEARRGMRLLLGGGAYADMLFPDRDVANVETNTGSIIMRVVYGETEFMLSGDAPASVEKYLVSLGGELRSDVLKAGHHGSQTSNSEEFVDAVQPSYVVYSRGCDNSYGHPSSEVVSLFQKLKIPALDTCGDGTITFRSDGRSLSLRLLGD